MVDRDAMENNLLATGALFGLLSGTDCKVEPVQVNGQTLNQLRVRFGFLKSPYILTIEAEPEEEVDFSRS